MIRRSAHAMHYPNLLHYDPAYAAASRWGRPWNNCCFVAD